MLYGIIEGELSMKVNYDSDEDILMLVLSKKKVDDSYETENSIVSVAEDGEPVMIDIFHASKFLKDLGKAVPKKVQEEVWAKSSPAVFHKIK
jgi:uncharacterized protein YuzE